MAKFFRCWVIVAGTQPTAFRAREREDLLPTLKQLQRTQPDITLLWFERGRLWRTPEEAASALIERRRAPVSRGRDWRPGGEHKDPKARPQIPRDEKRALFKKRLISKKSRGDSFPSADGGRRPPSGSAGTRPPSGRPPGPSSTHRGPSGPPPPRRPPSGSASSAWRPPGPPSSGRRPPSGSSPYSRQPPGPPSSRRPPSAAPSSRRPSSGRPPSGRPPSGRPPSGRPPSGRPPGKPPRGRNGK